MTSIKLFRGEFGHISVLNVASDFVTHAHAGAQFTIWLEGAAGEMSVGGQTVRLGPTVAAGINPYEPHSHALAGDGRPGLFLIFYLDGDWTTARRGARAGEPLFARAAVKVDPWLRRAALALLDRLSDGEPQDDLSTYEVERLIDSLLDAGQPTGPARATRAGALDYRVRKAIELMRANVCERISLDDVARQVGLSRPHFFALFKEQTRLTPNVYWNTLRMEEAQRRLCGSREPLVSVACDLGFNSQGNFTRFFRDHAGVPPTLYREAARAGA